MSTVTLPARRTMVRAFLDGDSTYDGVFYTAVRTTGVFCRPGCRAKKPRPENVSFYPSSEEAMSAGFRPCKLCRPLEPAGKPASWLSALLDEVHADPTRRWRDADLAARGLHPDRVRRWFQKHYAMTFHAYSRAQRVGAAIEQIHEGDKVIDAAYETGFESLSGFNEAVRRLAGAPPKRAGATSVVTITHVSTPFGPMLAGATTDALCLLEFTDRKRLKTQLQRMTRRLGCSLAPGTSPVLETAAGELESYFAGKLERFTTALHVQGTPFQEEVWKVLLTIPYGETRSYADIAAAIGQPRAVRAVARANGDNRIAIIIPCHRVIGSDGKLTGYGGGLWRKRRLLDLEAAQAVIPG